MMVKCYAVFDAKIADFHLAIFDIKDEGAIRQFNDALQDKNVKWSRHPEDYSLWYVGQFDTSKGMLYGDTPRNLVNASALISVRQVPPEPLELFAQNGVVKKEEPVN